MSRVRTSSLLLGVPAAAALLAISSPARADEPRSGAASAESAARGPKLTTAELIPTLHRINQMEIDAGKMAEGKGTSQGVKDYGETLRRDHTSADQQLTSVAKESHLDLDGKIPAAVQQDLQHAKREMDALDNVSGAAFDERFARAMEQDHRKAIGLVNGALPQVTDARVKDLLQQLLPTLRQHEQTAARLLKETHRVSSSNATMAPSGTSRAASTVR